MSNDSSPPVDQVTALLWSYYHQIDLEGIRERDTIDWFVQLPRPDKTRAAGILPEQWPLLSGFRRYFLEKQGLLLAAYLRQHLTRAEFATWADPGDNIGQLLVEATPPEEETAGFN